jgi:hypothetical protein
VQAPALLPDARFPASFGKSAVLLPFSFLLIARFSLMAKGLI